MPAAQVREIVVIVVLRVVCERSVRAGPCCRG